MKVWFLVLSLMAPTGLGKNRSSGGKNPKQPESAGGGQRSSFAVVSLPSALPQPPLRANVGVAPPDKLSLTLHIPFAGEFSNSFCDKQEDERALGLQAEGGLGARCQHRSANKGHVASAQQRPSAGLLHGDRGAGTL